MQPMLENPNPSKYGDDEWRLRVDLAAAYRQIALLNMDDAIFTHISVRLPTETPTFLINPYGMTFDEVTASSLVTIDIDGNKICDSDWPVNPAGFSIHSAIHSASPHAHCVMHTHTMAGMAVAALEEGLLPINQMSLHFHNRLARYSYDTIHFPEHEKKRLVAELGERKAMLMDSHGLLTVGRTVSEAFFYMYYLEKACRVQIQVLSMNRPFRQVSREVAEEGARLFESLPEQKEFMWTAFVRKLSRDYPEFAT